MTIDRFEDGSALVTLWDWLRISWPAFDSVGDVIRITIG